MLVDYIRGDALLAQSSGHLPFGMTIEKLRGPHKSMPTNPLIAAPMYWCGYIEKLGTGTEDILKKCSDYGLKNPIFQQDEDFRVTFWRLEAEERANVEGDSISVEATQKTTQKNTQENTQENLILSFCEEYRSVKEILARIGLKDGRHLKRTYLKHLIETGLVEPLYPDTP